MFESDYGLHTMQKYEDMTTNGVIRLLCVHISRSEVCVAEGAATCTPCIDQSYLAVSLRESERKSESSNLYRYFYKDERRA